MKAQTQIEIKERPILFSGPMVKAILDGRKTQTRRVVKPQPTEYMTSVWEDGSIWFGQYIGDMDPVRIACPYGKPGDRLWVREAFRVETDGDEQFVSFVADGKTRYNPRISEKWTHSQAVAFGDAVNGPYARPSIHMPKFISRINLEITNVRVERLQDISALDIEAEGIPNNPMNQPIYRNDLYQRIHDFEFVWDGLNGKKHPWESNPWVWVIQFNKLS